MGVFGEFVSGIYDYEMQQEAQEYDKFQADLAYNRSIKERDYMNKYNSPVEQIKRFKEAGLNPNLAYGQGTPGNQVGEVAKYQAQKGRVPKLNTTLGVLTIQEQKAQIENIRAQTESQKLDNKFKDQTLHDRTRGEFLKRWEFEGKAEEAMNKQLFNEKYRKELVEIMWKQAQNKLKVGEFEAWLAEKKMSKSDSIIARKLFHWAEKTGFDKRLEATFLNRYNKSN